MSMFKRNNRVGQLRIDAITGFYNRTYYEVELIDIIKKRTSEKRFCMFADFNFLKYANDMYGYDKVDEALKKISTIILEETKKIVEDSYVIRYGGDEVCIFGFGIEEEKVNRLKHEIQTKIKNLPTNESLNLSLAVGFSYDENDNKSFDELLFESKKYMKSDKNFIKETYSVNVKKAVELILPTIQRMVGEKDYSEFISILEKELGKE